MLGGGVVICFHFTIFVVLETTLLGNRRQTSPLWFAFILLSLSYWKQLLPLLAARARCCDLLSFYYLCRTGNNSAVCQYGFTQVVICFHFTIFVVLETTTGSFETVVFMLWFAFILLSLSYWKQHYTRRIQICHCCDLLSFYYLCRTGNNKAYKTPSTFVVVICFHFTIFVVLETTPRQSKPAHRRCDLLSFYYLCRTGNNWIYIICCISVCYKDNWNTKNVVSDRM